MKFSFVVPVYNLENYIEATLECLQGFGIEAEIVVVDDGSSDNTKTIIENYVTSNTKPDSGDKSNIVAMYQDNAGVSVARNTGIGACKGEYIVFVDGDDICDRRIMDICTDSKKDIYVWRFQTVTDRGTDGKKGAGTDNSYANSDAKVSQSDFLQEEYTSAEFLESLLSGKNRIRIGSFAVKKELLDRAGIVFTPGCAICEDVEFIYKIILSADSIGAYNDVLYTYVKRPGSAINTYDMRRFEAPVAINRVYEYAVANRRDEYDEYIMDSLKYGLFITHCMYSFDSCCRFIKDKQEQSEFYKRYKNDFGEIENKIKEAKLLMRYEPEIFSWKRRKLFLFSRKLYVKYVCKQE